MRSRRWDTPTWAAPVLAALVACGSNGPACLGQQAPASAAAPAAKGWTPLQTALQVTAGTGTPTVVLVTSRQDRASQAVRDALPGALAWSRLSEVQLAELPAESYPSQVRALNLERFPCVLVYRRGQSGVEAIGFRDDLTDAGQVLGWLATVDLAPAPAADGTAAAPGAIVAAPAPAPARDEATRTASATGPAPATRPTPAPGDVSVAQSQYQYPSGQGGYASEQRAITPPPPVKQPPYNPPPQQPVYAPPQQPVYTAPPPQQPQQYVPAPQPVVVQAQTPAMIVQQAPQQIVLAPPPPPQITVAMAPQPTYAPVAAVPTPNLFTQPMQAPQPQPMQAPQPQPVMMAPQPQPVMMAPQPMQAPQQPVAQAPAPVAQAPAAMYLEAPGLVNNLLGAVGEHLARRRNPRLRMSSVPTLGQAPMAAAPMAMGVGMAPAAGAYAPVTAYAPAGPPMALVTPESTAFAPCNTYRSPCRYHGGPCPGPGGGGYAPPPAPYPAGSPQSGYGPDGAGHGWLDWFHRKN